MGSLLELSLGIGGAFFEFTADVTFQGNASSAGSSTAATCALPVGGSTTGTSEGPDKSSFDFETSMSCLEPEAKAYDSNGKKIGETYRRDTHPISVPVSRVEKRAGIIYQSLQKNKAKSERDPLLIVENDASQMIFDEIFEKKDACSILDKLTVLEELLQGETDFGGNT